MEKAARSGTRDRPVDIGFQPSQHPRLPVEVLTRAEMRRRAAPTELSNRQRAHFHQLIVCSGGNGIHHVDFEPIEMQSGTVLHIHPGQVQEFRFEPDFDAHMVIYRPDLHRTFLPGQEWFPGSDIPTRWNLHSDQCDVVERGIDELRAEQERFDGTPANVVLMESLLAAFLARMHLLVGAPASTAQLPVAYVSFRRHLEAHLRARPTITACATSLGYSTRTLDRACQEAVGQTAKEVLDDRIAFEIRRFLTHTDVSITRIGATFHFADASSFSKFVQRHLGASPTKVREASTSAR